MKTSELITRAHEQACKSGFWEFDESDQEGLKVAQKLALIASEIAEFEAEAFERRPDAMLEELADVVIRVFDLAGHLDLKIAETVLSGRLLLHSVATSAALAMYRHTAWAVEAHRKEMTPTMTSRLEDVIRAAQDYAAYFCEDSGALRKAVEEKMRKNENREYRHNRLY